ncbi:MAG: Shedu anti-phage system protein SduA domain-containing protein [Candidatus Altiarchaeota archaeon]
MAKEFKKKTDFSVPRGSTEVDSDKWEDDTYASKISYEITQQGREGIRVLSAKKTNYTPHYGVWLDKKIDYSNWYKWFSSAFKKLARIFGKKIETAEDIVQRYEKELQDMSKTITELTLKYERAKNELEQNKKDFELARKLVDNIDVYEKGLEEIRDAINKSYDENSRLEGLIKQKIIENRWVLGLDCEVQAKERRIDNQTSLDLHIKTDLGEDRVFEFKSPNIRPFFKENQQGRFHINSEIAEGLNQLMIYLTKIDFWGRIKEGGIYGVTKPAGVVITGYKLPEEDIDVLKTWNFHLRPHIRFVTYDELIRSAENNLDIIRKARQLDKVD